MLSSRARQRKGTMMYQTATARSSRVRKTRNSSAKRHRRWLPHSIWRLRSVRGSLPAADGASHRKKKSSHKGNGTGKSKREKRKVDLRVSDDVGTYVCGLIYFSSLIEMQKRTASRDVVFFHVSHLDGKGEVDIGIDVTKELVAALVDVWEARV
ncbi:hypothetical protein PMIN02_013150 [Paraphaeosphaeria minitans]